MRRFRLLILVWAAAAWMVPTALAFVGTSPPPPATASPTRTTTTTTFRHPTQQHAVFFGGDFSTTDAAAVIDDFYQTQPYLAAFMTCSFKASAADFVAQTRQQQQQQTMQADLRSSTDDSPPPPQQQQKVDVLRNLGFVFYGGLYQGMAQQFLFNDLYPSFFPFLTGWQNVAAQVALDMTIVSPLVCLPLAYVFKALFTNEGSVDSVSIKQKQDPTFSTTLTECAHTATRSIQSGLTKYVYDVRYQQLLFKYWALWIPVQSLTFGVIPSHYRVAFVAAVSFFWVFVLSTIAAATATQDQDVVVVLPKAKSSSSSSFS
eukprot:scaffold9872_cov164-Amphora_coffeaeformis.AAC.2